MKLESQVCSLGLAKKLKELGVDQESLFYWVNPELTENNVVQLLYEGDRFINHHPDLYYSAFTVAELGEMLPDWCDSIRRYENDWVCNTFDHDHDRRHHSFGKTEADARAKMLVFLIERGVLKLTEYEKELDLAIESAQSKLDKICGNATG